MFFFWRIRHLDPGSRTVETPLIGHIIDEKNAHSTAVVCRGDGSKTFLACGIPYLQLHALAIELDRPDLEVDADGGDERRSEGVFTEAQKTARLADA